MPPPTTAENLLACAYHWESQTPDRLLFTQPMGGEAANVKTWTWKEAVGESRCMAAYLKALDLPDRSQIAICSKNCAHWIMADLAIWMAGHVSVPVFPILPVDIVRYTLTHSESKLLFVGKLDPIWEEMKHGVPDGLPMIDFPLAPPSDHDQWDDIVAAHDPLADPVGRSREELATVIYTSGSTGMPKGVMLSFGAMVDSARGASNYLNTHENDRSLSYLPLSHAFERFAGEAHFLYAGYPVWFADTLETFIQDLQRARPTLFISVPRLWLKFQLGVFEKIPPKKLDRFLKIPILSGIVKKKILTQLGLNHVRFAASGSAPIPKEVIDWYRRLGLELLEGYGMTENFSYSHVTKPGEVRTGYVGAPFPGVEHRISENGEVLVKSPATMMGYFKMPEQTKEVLPDDGFLKTGDLGEIDDKNRLKITGRIKELFKTSKGKYVAPAPIENMLSNHPRVEACCVSGIGHPQPYAVVMLPGGVPDTLSPADRAAVEKELREHLEAVNSTLQHHEQLAFLAVAKDEWLPENGFLTPTMKLRRNHLESVYAPMADQWFAQKSPVVWEA